MKFTISIFFAIIAHTLYGQKVLSQHFKFQSGVYLSFEEFQSDQPTYMAEDIEGNFFINPTTKQAKVEYIRLKSNKEPLDFDKMWGVCINGIPYIKVSPKLPHYSLKAFSELEVRGKICYFAYDDTDEKQIPFSVYNPLTKKPFRTTKIKREVPVFREKMLSFETGELVDFNYANLKKWIKEDGTLLRALESLGPDQDKDSLFKCLLLYDDKYEVYLK